MKTIQVKQHPSVQLAHLYEQLYIASFKRFMYRRGILSRLASWMQSIEYHSQSDHRPHPDAIYDETRVYMGGAGWRKYGNTDNLRKLLAKTSLEQMN